MGRLFFLYMFFDYSLRPVLQNHILCHALEKARHKVWFYMPGIIICLRLTDIYLPAMDDRQQMVTTFIYNISVINQMY